MNPSERTAGDEAECQQDLSLLRTFVGGELAAEAEPIPARIDRRGQRALVEGVVTDGEQTTIPIRLLKIGSDWYLSTELFCVNE